MLLNRKDYLVVLITIFIFWFFILSVSGSLFSGYHFIDDHEIIDIFHDFNDLHFGLLEEIVKRINSDIFEFHRFRPLYFVHRVIQTKIFGINWFIWSVYTGILAVLSTFFTFTFARLINFSFQEAIIFTCVTMVGSQSSVWWRLGPAETIGTFILSLVLLFTVISSRNRNSQKLFEVLFVISIILMSLCKESFVIIIPAIVFIKIWVYSLNHKTSLPQSFQRNLLSIFILSLTCLGEIAFIKTLVGTDFGYAGLEIDFLGILNAFNGYQYRKLFSPLIFLLVLALLFKSPREYIDWRKNLYYPLFIFFIIVLPQAILYTKSGLTERYIFPGIIGYSFLIGYVLKFITQQSKILSKITVLVIVIFLSLKLNMVFINAQNFAKNGRSTTALLNRIEMNTTPNSSILIAINPWAHYEGSFSIKIYLNYVAKRNNLYLATYGTQKTNYFTDAFLGAEQAWLFLNPEAVEKYYEHRTIAEINNKKSIECIVVFPGLKNDFLKNSADWFSLKNYQEYNFNSFYIYTPLAIKSENRLPLLNQMRIFSK